MAKAAPAKKAPVKELINFKQWIIENQEKADLKFSGDEVQRGYAFNIFGCNDTVIDISGKCKSVVMTACKKVTLLVDAAVTPVEIMNCSSITVIPRVSLRLISVEATSQVQVHLNGATKNCIIQTCCAKGITVRYPKDDATDKA